MFQDEVQKNPGTKLAYESPVVTEYGSVSEIVGNVTYNASANDGTTQYQS
jgi:hypothetical protein